eukprot:Skav212839  [mRNA]  locus=scaffold2466:258193:262252:- [translate_table: standard]
MGAQRRDQNLLVHVADNSYSLKPWDICSHWGDLERNYKLPIQPLNDRNRANVPVGPTGSAQIVNIQHIIVPQTKLLVQLIPELRSCLGPWKRWRKMVEMMFALADQMAERNKSVNWWIVKWRRSRPDHEELQRAHWAHSAVPVPSAVPPQDEIRALENPDLEESTTMADHNARKQVTRRMSVRSVRSVVELASPLD